MTAQFELYEGWGGKFRWHLRAANGELIASGPPGGQPPYSSKAAAENGIKLVKTNAPDAAVVDAPVVHKTTAQRATERFHKIALDNQRKLIAEYRRRFPNGIRIIRKPS